MTNWLAFFLGLVQGVTEFFPVSSSGHLKLAQSLFGLQDLGQYLLFDIICHVGTLGAVLIVFRRDLMQVLFDRRKLGLLAVATLPLVPLVLVVRHIESLYTASAALGAAFLVSALFLLLARRAKERPNAGSFRDALIIGGAQAIALIPGISRSGATISSARLLGWDRMQAIRFSFLLSIPAIGGSLVIETAQIALGRPVAAIPITTYLIGFTVSLATGLVALLAVVKIIQKQKMAYFGWYCLTLGIVCLIFMPR